jgi:hypothetical protein
LTSRVVTLLISLPAIAVVFLPFAEETSPWDVAVAFVRWPGGPDPPLAYLAAPFFLAFILFWIAVRLLVWSRMSLAESVIGWTMIAASILATLAFNAFALSDILHHTNDGPKSLICTSLAILAGGGLLIFLRRRRMHRGEMIVNALYVAYLANTGICVPGFAQWANLGWYLVLPVVAVMLIRLACLIPWRRPFGRLCGGNGVETSRP